MFVRQERTESLKTLPRTSCHPPPTPHNNQDNQATDTQTDHTKTSPTETLTHQPAKPFKRPRDPHTRVDLDQHALGRLHVDL